MRSVLRSIAAVAAGFVVALGVLLTLAGSGNNLMLPPPVWFWVVSMLLFIPAACLGARMAPARA